MDKECMKNVGEVGAASRDGCVIKAGGDRPVGGVVAVACHLPVASHA
jgi:hypothetical protein